MTARKVVHTTPDGIEVRSYGDQDSMELARLLLELLPNATSVVGPEDASWCSASCYLDGRTIVSLMWARGTQRDLRQAAHQLAKGCRRDDTARHPYAATQSKYALKVELGMDPLKGSGSFRRPRRKRS